MSSFIFPPFHAFLRAHEETEARRPTTAANGFGERRTALFLSIYRSSYKHLTYFGPCVFPVLIAGPRATTATNIRSAARAFAT